LTAFINNAYKTELVDDKYVLPFLASVVYGAHSVELEREHEIDTELAQECTFFEKIVDQISV
jgi:hypothetical protein